MSRLHLVILLFVVSILKNVFCGNILFIDAVLSPSHHIWNMHIVKALVNRGHNVTILTHSAEKTPIKNLHFIQMEGVYEKVHDSMDYLLWAEEKIAPKYSDILMLYEWQEDVTKLDLQTKGLARMRNYPDSFKVDLIIIDATAFSYLYTLIDKFNRPPVVAVTPYILPAPLNAAMGNHLFTSYTPSTSTAYSNQMSMVERFHNTIYHIWDWYHRLYVALPSQEQMARDYFGEKYVRPLAEYEQNFSVLLCNYEPMFDYPMSLGPNVIPVGSLHARAGKELTADLKKIMDDAKHGVIYLSFGTNIKSAQLGSVFRASIIAALGRLQQTVLWKFEEEISGLPANIVTRKFFPQNDILGNTTQLEIVAIIKLFIADHPNLKAFITHGGALSTNEAMFFGVPLVAIPFFFDQKYNARKIALKKVGQFVMFNEVTADSLYNTIQEVITNPIYKKTCDRISGIVRSRPQSALDTAMFWIDQTMKYGYIKELRLPTNKLTFIEVHNLDIFVTPFIVLFIVLIAIKCVTKKQICKSNAKLKTS